MFFFLFFNEYIFILIRVINHLLAKIRKIDNNKEGTLWIRGGFSKIKHYILVPKEKYSHVSSKYSQNKFKLEGAVLTWLLQGERRRKRLG